MLEFTLGELPLELIKAPSYIDDFFLPVRHCGRGRNILDHWSCLVKFYSTSRRHIFGHWSRHSIGDSRRGQHGFSHLDNLFQNLRHWHVDNSLLHPFTRGQFDNFDSLFQNLRHWHFDGLLLHPFKWSQLVSFSFELPPHPLILVTPALTPKKSQRRFFFWLALGCPCFSVQCRWQELGFRVQGLGI